MKSSKHASMKPYLTIFLTLFILMANSLQAQINEASSPLLTEKMIFAGVNGVIPVEAEFFYKQEKSDIRYWVRQNVNEIAKVSPDADRPHLDNSSYNSYIEILPDTRVTHDDKLIRGTNFSNQPGAMGILHYKVSIKEPGRYYVWVRAFSEGAEDNSIHVGLNGDWPEHGQRMQWCDGKNTWTWSDKQRTAEVHCGVPKEIYLDIDKAGIHNIQFSMREDGFEFDKFILTRDSLYIPEGKGEVSNLVRGKLPDMYPEVGAATGSVKQDEKLVYIEKLSQSISQNKLIKAVDFPVENTNYYLQNNWLAVNPEKYKEAKTTATFNYTDGTYDLLFIGVGESDGQSVYQVFHNDKEIINYAAPLSKAMFEEGNPYNYLLENVSLKKGDRLTVIAQPNSADGKEYSRGRWSGIIFSPVSLGKEVLERGKTFSISMDRGLPAIIKGRVDIASAKKAKSVYVDKNGNGDVVISGELKQWHKVNLTMDGPFASEMSERPNPFTDYRMTVSFTHESGEPTYVVPAYFGADGNAAESGANEGTKWRAHLSPDKTGTWNYEISFFSGAYVATADMPWMKEMSPYHGKKGSFEILDTNKTGRDFRGKGRLEYVGKHHLQFKGSGEYFFKAGTDAPETLLGYEDFDNTITMKSKVPLKKYEPHLKDYTIGDPTWKKGKGKALIGAVNYLSKKGANSMSFLTYNAGGDGDNVWPFVSRNEKLHYDCSKLDQWQIVFDHAQSRGIYLHFKTQETENDDQAIGPKRRFKMVPEALDAGDLGPERRLYYRELIARYGYLLALNWNLGEENTQTTENHKAMARYFYKTDPYQHNVVLHTYPNQQELYYLPLLGNQSTLTGLSLQNEWDHTFKQTLQWVNKSDSVGKPWIVANDEQGSAGKGVPPDPEYKGFDASQVGYDIHDIRKQTLWGNLMAGGAGVEYYFGYQLPENDLKLEDFYSRDRSWDFCKVAIDFLSDNNIPFQDMKNRDVLIGNPEMSKDKHCFAKEGKIYLVHLAYVNTSKLDLTADSGTFRIYWFDPVNGGALQNGSVKKVKAGQMIDLGNSPASRDQDWVVLLRKN